MPDSLPQSILCPVLISRTTQGRGIYSTVVTSTGSTVTLVAVS